MRLSLGHFALPLLLTALAAAAPSRAMAQTARLLVPADGTRRAGAPADSDDVAPPSRADSAYRARELDRLRRRTGRPQIPVAPERSTRSRSDIPADGGFQVVVETDAPEYLVDEDGVAEAMYIRITPAADGYLTLLSGGTGRQFTVLAPNDLIAQLPVRAGEPVEFPLREWLVQGVELRPQLPANVDVSQQVLVAVVTRRAIPLPLYDVNAPGRDDVSPVLAVRTFQNWLARIPANDRGVGQVFYTVRRR